MAKFTVFVMLQLIATMSVANEMHRATLKKIEMSGVGKYGDPFHISIQLEEIERGTKIESIVVHVHSRSNDVSERILDQVLNPHVNELSIINSSGVYGSYYYISLPFGETRRCGVFRRKAHDELYIHTNAEGDIERASIRGACE